MKKVFMILGAGLLAALLVFSCSKQNNQKPNNKPDDDNKEQQGGEQEGGEEGFSMEVNIDGDFSEWDALTADTADGEYYIYDENSDPDYNGILRLKLASDEDNIYVYTEINYEYIFVMETEEPTTGGGSWTGFIPQHIGTPGALIIYVGCDNNEKAAFGARRITESNEIETWTDDDPSMWDYMGFDAFPQFYFGFCEASNKMAFGWNQNNWPQNRDDWDSANEGLPLGDHGLGWWGDDVEGTPVSDNTVSNGDTFKFSPVMTLKEPASKKDIQAVKIEFAMDRSAINEDGTKVNGTAVIGAFYENISQTFHQTESRGAGKLPSGDKPLQLKLK